MKNVLIMFKKRSDHGPELVGLFPTQQTANEHLAGLTNRGVKFKAVLVEVADFGTSLQWCEGDDRFELGLLDGA